MTPVAGWEAIMQAEDPARPRRLARRERTASDAVGAHERRIDRDVASDRLLLKRSEAASALGMSLDHFERYCQPHLRIVRSGRLRLVPRAELTAWIQANAEYAHA